MYVFGDLTNLYVNYDISLQLFSNTSNALTDIFSDITFDNSASVLSIEDAYASSIISPNLIMYQDNLTEFLLLQNTSFILPALAPSVSCVVFDFAMEQSTSVYLTLLGLANGTYVIKSSDGGCDCMKDVFSSFSAESRCLTDRTFIHGERAGDGILWTVYLFIIIAAAVFITSYIQIALMLAACERQVQKMRLLYYKSVLRQDISWFDLNPSGEVSSRLNE